MQYYPPEKYATTIGDGVNTEILVTHNLGTLDVFVEGYLVASPHTKVDLDWNHEGGAPTNTITIFSSVAFPLNSVKVLVSSGM